MLLPLGSQTCGYVRVFTFLPCHIVMPLPQPLETSQYISAISSSLASGMSAESEVVMCREAQAAQRTRRLVTFVSEVTEVHDNGTLLLVKLMWFTVVVLNRRTSY